MERDTRMVIDKDEQLEFCSFEDSVELQKLGLILDSPFAYYTNDGEFIVIGDEYKYKGTGAPLLQQAFRYFSEAYGLISQITYDSFDKTFGYQIDSKSNIQCKFGLVTYEDAEELCLYWLIKTAKEIK